MSTTAISVKKLTALSELIRLPKQYGTLLVLWPTLWSLFIAAGGRPSLKLLVIFIIGTFLMRSAGCAINDIADRNFDPLVERTRRRPLASGALTVKEALFVFVSLSTLAFALVLFLNPLTIILSFVGILLAAVYPFVKRVSSLPQTFLGMAFGWGAVMAWTAVRNTIGPAALLIFTANIFWSMAYDTIYALMDIDDDIKIGVKSTAILFGRRVYLALNILYLAFSATLAAAGWLMGLGLFYYLAVGLGLCAFLWIVRAVQKNPVREVAFRGFVANAVVGGLMLLFIIVDLNLRP
ncbi:MAG: 4-hydroxybenzoate octaprenyltransferase [Thermodesulfobacteriota bacterium]